MLAFFFVPMQCSVGENIYATKAIWVGLDSMGIGRKKRGMLYYRAVPTRYYKPMSVRQTLAIRLVHLMVMCETRRVCVVSSSDVRPAYRRGDGSSFARKCEDETNLEFWRYGIV